MEKTKLIDQKQKHLDLF